ncbi:hypothetical protein GLAREA_13065 [Glarea lozoyensis ATCC 20868]|uniref:HTH merR-type domain-containing protein n=1 Tax=Glarea lozoyensis (strain ATCC 20868 / MF5171) TaxID=1116229 RepID=S3CUC9_GLAL2|nr:uncharacterized protein GLAREA_13065 [Glarea lozoyensis ATCC 20868]EPE30017.1 hypothetical protein GLAREA_13065 [Glarea lozoyensis ATCC 20868]
MGTPLGEIAAVLSLGKSALKLYNTCFNQIQEPGDQLLEFETTLLSFTGNLEVVQSISDFVASGPSDMRKRLQGFQQLDLNIRASKIILQACDKFLKEQAATIQKRGLMTTLKFLVKDGSQDLKDLQYRIQNINSQLNTSILTINLNLQIIYGGRIEERKWPELDPLRRDSVTEPLPLQVPFELARSLTITARQQHSKLENAPVTNSIETSIVHLSRAKNRLEYASKNPIREGWKADVVLDLMISAWILTALVKPRFKDSASNLDMQATSEDTKPRIRPLVWRVEEELRNIFDTNSLGSFESDKADIDQVLSSFDSRPFIQWESSTAAETPPTDQLEGMESYLQPILTISKHQSESSTQKTTLYLRDEKTLIIVKATEDRDKRTKDRMSIPVPLHSAQFVPIYAFPNAKRGVWNASIQTTPNSMLESLSFKSLSTLHQFQQAITAYEVKYFEKNIAMAIYDGKPKKEDGKSKGLYGKLQIWIHNPIKPIEKEEDSLRRLPSVTSNPVSSILSGNGKRSTRNASESSLQLKSAQTTRTSIRDKKDRIGILVDEPEPPYLILFVEGESTQKPLSFISIEMNLSTTVKLESNANAQSYRAVVEASGDLAAERHETANLAAAGIYQRGNTPEVAKKL